MPLYMVALISFLFFIFGAGTALIFLEYTECKRRNMKENITIRLADTAEDSRYIHVRPLDKNFEPISRPLTEEEQRCYENILYKNWQ